MSLPTIVVTFGLLTLRVTLLHLVLVSVLLLTLTQIWQILKVMALDDISLIIGLEKVLRLFMMEIGALMVRLYIKHPFRLRADTTFDVFKNLTDNIKAAGWWPFVFLLLCCVMWWGILAEFLLCS